MRLSLGSRARRGRMRSSATSRPSAMRSTRSQRSARPISCVIRISGRVVGARHLEQEIHHLLAGGAVEIAGRLVGQHQLRLADEGAGHRHALLLAARELCGIVADAMAEARRRFERGFPPARTHRERPANSSGSATFSCAVMVGMRWKPWKTMPIWSRRRRARVVVAHRPRSRPATSTWPDVRALQPARDHHQGSTCRHRKARPPPQSRRAAMSTVMLRRMLTVPASLAMSRCTSVRRTIGGRTMSGQAGSWTEKQAERMKLQAAIWWFCGRGQFTARSAFADRWRSWCFCGRGGPCQASCTNRAGQAVADPGRQPARPAMGSAPAQAFPTRSTRR